MTTRIRKALALATTRQKSRRCTPLSSSLSTVATDADVDATSSYIVVGNGPVGASVARHLVELVSEQNSGSTVGSDIHNPAASHSNHRAGSGSDLPLVTIVDGRPSGMGSSHADRARLIRTFDAEGDLHWTRWNQRSLRAFPELERVWNDDNKARSKHQSDNYRKRKQFFTRCGGLLLGDKEFVERSMRAAQRSMAQSPSSSSSSDSLRRLSPLECQSKWPYLRPDPGCNEAIFDPAGGLVDPMAFVRAQNHAARRSSGGGSGGASRAAGVRTDPHSHRSNLEIRSDVAVRIHNGGLVELASGKMLRATEKVVLCGGAFSNALLDDSAIFARNKNNNNTNNNRCYSDRDVPAGIRPLLRVSKRTVALLEVNPEVVHGMLRDMPTIKYAFGLLNSSPENGDVDAGAARNDHDHDYDHTGAERARDQSAVEAGSVYVLPPVRYPERDGKWFVKIGGGPNEFFADDECHREGLEEWLSSGGGGDPSSVEWLEGIVRSLLPEVPLGSAEGMTCVTTVETPSSSSSSEDNKLGVGVVVNDALLDDRSLVAVSACQGKGAGPADAVGRDVAQRILVALRDHEGIHH
eukprot:jgi/Psemu1/202997/e_gw1.311.8.1